MALYAYAGKALTFVLPANLFHTIRILYASTQTHTGSHCGSRCVCVSVCKSTEIVGVFLMLSESLKCCWPICEQNDHDAECVCVCRAARTCVRSCVRDVAMQ